jgi:hypothetical protein
MPNPAAPLPDLDQEKEEGDEIVPYVLGIKSEFDLTRVNAELDTMRA